MYVGGMNIAMFREIDIVKEIYVIIKSLIVSNKHIHRYNSKYVTSFKSNNIEIVISNVTKMSHTHLTIDDKIIWIPTKFELNSNNTTNDNIDNNVTIYYKNKRLYNLAKAKAINNALNTLLNEMENETSI